MQKFKFIILCLPLMAISFLSCHAQKGIKRPLVATASAPPMVEDTFKAEKSKKGDAFPEMTALTWDDKILNTDGLYENEPILFVLFNPGCGHCKDIITAVQNNLGMLKGANIIFLAGKPLQGQLPKFVAEMKLDKIKEMVVAGDSSGVIDKIFEFNGIPQIMLYNKDHKLEHIYYNEASMLDIQRKMYGR